ncbi:hypothetical protein G6F31_016159 [Rhizopus arrhizus]|nr:hypothetical protein G6F31_016159 [Rhizopus arrhizus]
MGGGQHRVLAVVAAYVGRARAVGLHGDLAKQRGVALHTAHAVRVLAVHARGRARQDGDATGGHAFVQLGVQPRIGDDATQLRHAEVGVLDHGAAQPSALRDMNVADVGRTFGPGMQRFQQHATAMVHGQPAGVGRGRGRRIRDQHHFTPALPEHLHRIRRRNRIASEREGKQHIVAVDPEQLVFQEHRPCAAHRPDRRQAQVQARAAGLWGRAAAAR